MKIIPTAIDGAFIVEASPHPDERGSFARAFCAESFAGHGMVEHFVQCNLSRNIRKGTLRGMHYQDPPSAEVKFVRAVRGRVFDVAIDLRPESSSFRKWLGVELDAGRQNAFYIPEGCAHGFITLEDDCDVFYQVSSAYAPDLGRYVRWNDPAFGVEWPIEPSVMSKVDANAPDYYR